MQESTVHEVVAVGVDTSGPMVFDYGQTHTSTNGAAHVIKNEGVKLTATNIGGNAIEFELDDSFLGGCGGINDEFHNLADYNFYKDLGVSWDLKGCEDIEIALKKLSLSSILASWEYNQLDPFVALFAVCGQSSLLHYLQFVDNRLRTHDSYSQCFKEKTILQGCNIVEAISSVIDSMTSHGFQVKALISQTGAMLQPPDNGKISFSAAEIVYVPAAASGLPEQCESVDLPKSDQTFVFDTPLIHQASGCENSQNLYSPNDAAGALTNYEEIITPNHLQSRKGESKWALTRDSELDVACDADAKRELLTQFEDIGLPASPNEESESIAMVGVSMEVDITNEQNTCLALNDLPLQEHFSKREQFRDAGNDAAILADCLPTPESHNIDDFSIANHESIELTMEQRDGEADTRVHNPTCSQSISGNTSN
nr:hypothetical protein CFP56_45023 [Quercus suber]